MHGEDLAADRQKKTHNESFPCDYAARWLKTETFASFQLICSLTNQNRTFTRRPSAMKCFWKSKHFKIQTIYLVNLLLKDPYTVPDHAWDKVQLLNMGSAHLYNLLSCYPSPLPAPLPAQPHALYFGLTERFIFPRTCLTLSGFEAFVHSASMAKLLPVELLFILSLRQLLLQEGFPDPLSLDSPSALSDISTVSLITRLCNWLFTCLSPPLWQGSFLSLQPWAFCLANSSCLINDCWIKKIFLEGHRVLCFEFPLRSALGQAPVQWSGLCYALVCQWAIPKVQWILN